MRDHFIPDAVLLVENGKIVDFGEARKLAIPEGAEVIDAEGAYVGPGFVDIHTHSDGYVFFQDEPERASQHHLKHGTTTLLPALYFSMDTAGYLEAIAKLKEAMKKPECANIGALICFDSIYEELAIDSVRDGAEVLAIVTNDSWFFDSAAA